MVKIFTFNSTKVIDYSISILPVLQDFCFSYYQVYDWAFNKNNGD